MKIYNMAEILDALENGRTKGCTMDEILKQSVTGENIDRYLSRHAKKAEQMKTLAAEFSSGEIRSLKYSAYRQFDTTGERNDYQDLYFEHRNRMNIMGMNAWLFGEEKYLKETENILWAICEEYTWCLPAHLGGHSLENIKETGDIVQEGKIMPYSYSHRHTLDLFACETARDMAEILYLLGNVISPLIRDRALEEITERVFGQYLTFNRIHHFEVDKSNWSAVCGGSLGVAAMFLIADDSMLAPMIQRVISDMDVFLSSYGEDGICREGVGYWNYGFYNFCYFAWLLKKRTADKIDLFKDSGVKQAAFFPSRAFLYQNYCVNFSDCESKGGCARDLYGCLKEIYPDMPEITELAVPEADGGSRNIPITLRKIIWPDGGIAKEFRERSDYFPDAGWMISCKYWHGRALSCVVKGGNNAEPHNHNDLGHFILMSEGEQLLCDLGSGEYTKQYFGEGRYEYLVTSSAGHSVPIIAGKYQKAGAESQARMLEVKQGPEKDLIRMEIGSAYPIDSLNSLVRSFQIHKEEYTLKLCDSYRYNGDSLYITERFVSQIEPEIMEDGTVRITGKKCQLWMKAEKKADAWKINQEEFRKPGRKIGTAWLIDFGYILSNGEGDIAFQFLVRTSGNG